LKLIPDLVALYCLSRVMPFRNEILAESPSPKEISKIQNLLSSKKHNQFLQVSIGNCFFASA